MDRLAGRLAVVTGGTRGIGLATAHAFAREGARVVVCSRKEAGVRAAEAEINAAYPGKGIGRVLHVGKLDEITSFWDALQETVGTPDILVNNAGTNPHFGPLLTADWARWEKTFDVNLKGPFEMSRQLITRLDGRKGAIVNVSSILGVRFGPMQGIYSATKAALISLTRSMACELAEVGIPVRVNAIAPGVVETRLAAAITQNDDFHARTMAHTPMKRIGRPEEIAESILYLASDASSYVTGTTLFVDGGYTVA